MSQAGGSEPAWGPDGSEVCYRSTTEGENQLIAARVQTAPEFRVLSRQALHASYDVSPDGKSFVMVRRNAAGRLIVLQNFPEFFRRLQRPAQGQ